MRRFRYPGILIIPLFVTGFVSLFAGGLLAVSQVQASGGRIFFVDDSVNDGLVAHWKFDAVGAGTAVEVISRADGTLISGASMVSSPLPSVLFNNTGSLSLVRVGGRVDIADSPALNLSDSFSLTAWVKRSGIFSFDAIYDSGQQSGQWWVLFTPDDRLCFQALGVAETCSTQTIIDTNWHHIAVMKNGDTGINMIIFIDGVPRGQGSVGSLTTPSGPKQIGALYNPSNCYMDYFNGHLDDVRLYSRALAAAEVQQLAQGRGCVTDGFTWSTAFRDLQCALNTAVPGDQVWIAEGVYKPGVNPTQTFNLANGVNLHGGFLGLSPGGGETALDQRPDFNPDAPLTILSGDVLGNDAWGSFTPYRDNAYHVVTAGPGVSAELDRLGIRGGYALGGASDSDGGGLLVLEDAGPLILTEMAFLNNQASVNGGALAARAPVTLNKTSFIDNHTQSQGSGGGVYAVPPLTVTESVFRNNRAGQSGGAIFALQSLMVTQCDFKGNSVVNQCWPACGRGDGGAISSFGPLTVTNSTLADNFAMRQGGAIYGEGTTVVDSCLLTGNKAGSPGDADNPGKGGGIFVDKEAVLSGNVFEGNAAESSNSDGGGLYGKNGPVHSIGNRFKGNSAARLGGGAHLPGGSVNGDRYINNTASGEGGGLFTTGNLTITRTIFDGNASRMSGAVQADGPAGLSRRLDIDNSLFIRNRNTIEGAVADLSLLNIAGRVVNNTFADPGSVEAQSILALGSELQVINSIFSNFWLSLKGEAGAGFFEDYNLFFNAPRDGAVSSGGHSLTGDPLFVSPPSQDYRLTNGSPAIGAGLESALPVSIMDDLSGNSRRFGQIDIGAYEFRNPLFLPLIFKNATN